MVSLPVELCHQLKSAQVLRVIPLSVQSGCKSMVNMPRKYAFGWGKEKAAYHHKDRGQGKELTPSGCCSWKVYIGTVQMDLKMNHAG